MPSRREDIPEAFADLHRNEMLDIFATNLSMICKREMSETSTASGQSPNNYNTYRKLVNDNLLKLNSNISDMLTESFKGIDSICSKVRECISDFNPPEILEAAGIHPIPNRPESFADDKDTQQMIEKQKQDQLKYAELTKRYEIYRQKLRAEEGYPLELNADEFNKEDKVVRMVQEVPVIEKTIINETFPKQNESGCELDCAASLENANVEQEDEELEQNEEVPPSKTGEQFTDAIKPDNLSEISELSVTENVNIVEPKIPKPKRSISKSKLQRPKKRLRKRSLEEYTQAVKKEVDNADFESLQVIIQNLTERIDMLSTETLSEKCENINKPEEDKGGEYSEVPFKGCNIASFETNEPETIDDLFVSTTNSIKELLGAALSKALETEPVKRGKPRLNLTEVHHRPAFTNLHKKLLLQADTSESFLCLQRLMAKHKVKNSIIDRVFSKLKIPLLVNSSSESLKDEGSKFFDPSDLNLQESEDDQISELSAKYADSLYFNEKNMFKSSKLHLQQRHRSKKSMSNYSTSALAMEGNTEKVSPTATALKLNNGTWQSKLKKSTPKLIDSGKSRNRNHFKSGSSSLNMSAQKQRSYKRNSEVSSGGKRCDNKENIFGSTLVERNQSLFSLPNTKSSGSSVNVGLKSRSTVVRSKANVNDPTKTAPCEDEDLGLTPSLDYGVQGGECFLCSERPVCQCGVTNSSNANDDKSADKTKYHWMRPRNDVQMRIRGLDYLDILDDLTHKDLLPLRSEYPRKDLEDEEELGLDQNKDIQDTYLWKMMYGKEKNDNLWSHLLQPKVECVDKTCHFYDHQEKERRVATPVSLLDLPDKTFRALKQKSKRKTIEKLAPYLFDPKEERNNQSLIVMPVRVHYDNPPMQIIKHNISEEPEIFPCVTPKPAKRVKTSKLGPPSMKEVKSDRAKWVSPAKSKKRITSVQSTPKTNIRVHKVEDMKKEKHSASKKESNSFMNKPLTAFVPSFDDPQPEPQKLTPQQTAYKKAIMRNLNRLMEIKQKEKKEQQKIAAKDLALQQKYLATTNFPHYARPTIQSQNYFQRPAAAQNSDLKIDSDKKHPEVNATNAIKKLADVKPTADQRKPSPRAVDVEAAFSDTKSDFERKMLSYKYGKSVGDKLVSFLNNQPPSPHLVIPPPDLQVPPLPPPQPVDVSGIPKVGSATGARFLLNPNLMKGDNARNAPPATTAHKPTMNHRQVLLHLRGLKKKNSQIQNNIQKTISVIEDKMVDILNAPGNNTSLEAFDVMEKEITKVLSMMKSQGADSAASNRDKELLLENNLQDISIELFSKLEKILDSEHSKEATSASETDGKVTVRSSGESKKKKSRKAADRSSSVTTLLTEEKFRESQRNMKQKTKKPSQAQSDTKLKTQHYMPAEKETIATPGNQLAMGENVVNNDEDISEHIFDNKEDIDRDQGDQPDKGTVTKANAVFSDSDLDVIWDTNEQIERLDKLLKELQDENANKIDDRVEENDEAVLKRQNATTRLETVLGESKAEEEEEEDSGDLLESISSRINAFLESPRSEERPVSVRIEELSESVDRAGNDYYNPQSKDFPSPICECSSTTDTKADTSLSTPCLNDMSSSDSSLSEFPHKEDSSTVSPINETTSSDDEFLTPLRTELNLTSLDDDFLTPPEDLLLARLEEDALSSPDEQMFTPSGGQLDDELPSPIQEELWTSRDEILTPPSELSTPLTDQKLTPSTDEKSTKLTSEKLSPLFIISNEEMSTPLDDEVLPEGIIQESFDEIENNFAPDSEESTSDISEQMNEIIKKVEDIYAQLNDFQMPIDEKPAIPVFSDEKNVPQVPSEEFLTPFMHAVRETRSRQSGDFHCAHADSLESSPSFCNILHFLDTLNNEVDAEKVQEVHTTQLYNNQATLEYPIEYGDTDMHSCLKTRDDFKRKKKVSFSVTEDEISQASLQEHLSKSLSNVIHLEVDCVSIEDHPADAEEIQPVSSDYYFASADTVSSTESRRTVTPSKDHSEPPSTSVLVNGSYGKQISLFKNRPINIEPKFGLIGDYSSTTELLKLVPSKELLINFDYTPSFCNLINFFDTLNEMDTETAQEIHTARLYQTAYAYNIPTVLHQATIEYPIEYHSLPDKQSCLKTSNEAKQKKKVSFYEIKEDERAQSSFRMIKRTKMAIEELPQLEDSATSLVSKEHLERPTKSSDSASKVIRNVAFDSSNDSSEKEDSYTFGDTTPPSETVRNTSEISIVEENNSDKCSSNIIIDNRQDVGTPSITVIREYSNGEKNFNPPTYAHLVPSKEMLMNFKDNNVVFLKSFYAFMYLLVFTALNMEYKCY